MANKNNINNNNNNIIKTEKKNINKNISIKWNLIYANWDIKVRVK